MLNKLSVLGLEKFHAIYFYRYRLTSLIYFFKQINTWAFFNFNVLLTLLHSYTNTMFSKKKLKTQR